MKDSHQEKGTGTPEFEAREDAVEDVMLEAGELRSKYMEMDRKHAELLAAEHPDTEKIHDLEWQMAQTNFQIEVLLNGLKYGSVTSDSVNKQKKGR